MNDGFLLLLAIILAIIWFSKPWLTRDEYETRQKDKNYAKRTKQ